MCAIYQLIIFMEQSHFKEITVRSAGQEIDYILWNPKVRYCIRTISSLVHIQIQIILAHTFQPYIFKKNFNMPHLCSSILHVAFFLQILLIKALYKPLEQLCPLECDVSLGEYFLTFRRHRDPSEIRGKHISAISP